MQRESVIVSDPEILGGTPCFRGTRVPVDSLIDYLEAGDSLDEFLAPYSANTLYFSGTHTINAGTDITGDGIPVYSGTIQYYADHGANTP